MTELTLQDVNNYLTLIRINFENSYRTQNDKEREMLIRSWHEMLKEYPKEICNKAVLEAIKYAKFAPRIGDIVEQIEKMQQAFEKSEQELWAEMTGVLRKVNYNSYRYSFTFIEENGKTQGQNAFARNEAIFNALSPELKEYCRNLQGLVEIARYTDDELAYERGRFMRTMPQVKQRAKTRQAMPVGLAQLVQGLATQWRLGFDETKLLQGE
jgi:hypothetical protein